MPEGDNYGDLRQGLKRIKRRKDCNMSHAYEFQKYCWDWLTPAFGQDSKALELASSPWERGNRALEEMLELCQTNEVGMTEEQAIRMVRYVFNRSKGEVRQEIGGTAVTFASLCQALGYDMLQEGWREIQRCYRPEVMEKIRQKQVSKDLHGIGGTPVKE